MEQKHEPTPQLPSAKEIHRLITHNEESVESNINHKDFKISRFPMQGDLNCNQRHCNFVPSLNLKSNLDNPTSPDSHRPNQLALNGGERDVEWESGQKIEAEAEKEANETAMDNSFTLQVPICIDREEDCAVVTYADGSTCIQNKLIADLSDNILNESHNFTCAICGEVRSNKHSYQRHLSSHAEATPCIYCGKLLKSLGRPDVLKRHNAVCKSRGRRSYKKQIE